MPACAGPVLPLRGRLYSISQPERKFTYSKKEMPPVGVLVAREAFLIPVAGSARWTRKRRVRS